MAFRRYVHTAYVDQTGWWVESGGLVSGFENSDRVKLLGRLVAMPRSFSLELGVIGTIRCTVVVETAYCNLLICRYERPIPETRRRYLGQNIFKKKASVVQWLDVGLTLASCRVQILVELLFNVGF
jgi:hypothetical protein